MTRKEHKTTPKVVWQTLYTDSAAVSLESTSWFDWLTHNALFEMESPAGTFTARRELRGGAAFWYAYRRHRNKLYKTELGRSTDLSMRGCWRWRNNWPRKPRHERLIQHRCWDAQRGNTVARVRFSAAARPGVPNHCTPGPPPFRARGGRCSSGSGGQLGRMP